MKSLIASIAAVVLVLTAAQAHAALLAYDGFETVASGAGAGQYNAASLGLSGGQGPGLTGFDSGTNWVGTDHVVRPINAIDTTSLIYPDLPTISGSVFATRVSATGGFLSTSTRAANTAGSLPEADVTRWISFLIQPDMNFVGSVSGTNPFALTTTFGQDLRFALADDLGAGSLSLTIIPDDTTTPVGNRTLSLTEDQTHLVLMRIEHFNGTFGAASEDISVWLDPDLSLGESGLGTADVSANGVIIASDTLGTTLEEFDTVDLRAALENNASLAQAVFFDEFRVGTTAVDVGVLPPPPVPEPSSLLLLGLGALGLMRHTRRRRPRA